VGVGSGAAATSDIFEGVVKRIIYSKKKKHDFLLSTSFILLTYLLHGAESFLRSLLVLQLVKKFPAFLEP
jgi:hypothetical protein